MIYFLKSLYSFLFPPGLFIVLLLLLGIWLCIRVRRSAGPLLLLIAFLLYASSTPLVGDALLGSLENRYEPPAEVQGDVYVLLTGGAVTGTPDVDGVGHLSGHTLHRVVSAAELYAKKPLPILVSGGQVYEDSGNEGQISKRKLIALGVPEKDILLDDQSRTTQENALNSKRLLDEHGLQHPILLTSAFHMVRSVKHFGKQGVQVLPYPVDYQVSRKPGSWPGRVFLPNSAALDEVSMAFKEYLGLLQ